MVTSRLTTARQLIPTLRDERDVIEQPPTRRDVVAECFADTSAAVALTNKGKTLLALDAAAECGRMIGIDLWQKHGADETTFRQWGANRGFVVVDVTHPSGLRVLHLEARINTADIAPNVTYYFDGPVRR